MQACRDGQLIDPEPGCRAMCPLCGASVRAKCGDINVWHFAHIAADDCDPWSEPESPWHRSWKALVPASRREVTYGAHRADIVTERGTVVELQHGSLAIDEALAREEHYGRMVWLLDGTDWAAPRSDGSERFGINHKDDYWTFRWRWCWRWVLALNKPVFIDRGVDVFEIRKIYGPGRAAGWGILHPRRWFVDIIAGEST